MALRRKRVLLGCLGALAALALVQVAAAQADSIVYVKGGNVWVAAPDGSPKHKLTRDGKPRNPYAFPTQSNKGIVVALRGKRLYRFKRSGKRIGKPIPTVLQGKPAGVDAVGPFGVEVSPDGGKVAYWVGVYSRWEDDDYTWVTPGSAVVWQSLKKGRVLGVTHHYEDPSWLDGSRALLWEDTNVFTANAVVAGIGESHNDVDQWFHDDQTRLDDEWKPIGAGELSRGGTKLALLRAGATTGNGGLSQAAGNTIALYSVSGLVTPPTMWPCVISDAIGGEFGPPSWSPAGDALAWAEGNGVWTSPVGGSCESLAPRLAIAGAAQPDWGPAAVGRAAKRRK